MKTDADITVTMITTGFSPRNLRDMKRFYLACADEAIRRQAVDKLPGMAAR